MARTVPTTRLGPRRPRSALGRLSLLASLPFLAASPIRAEPAFPPSADFRSLQLITLACSRENSTEPCARARSLADPLMDHPRLPASCKDVLWTIRQRAVVATSNSFERRERIDRAARRLTSVCRQRLPAAKPAADGAANP